MDAVKAFNDELSGIYDTKPPISRAKMTLLTKKAIKGIKFYKHIVQSMEKFVQKCRSDYKVPGLYVIDSVVRQSRHQFGPGKDVFMPRLCKNIITTFQHIYKCPPEDKPRILRVLNLWQKNSVFPQDIVQQLTVMGGAPTPDQTQNNAANGDPTQKPSEQPDPANLTNLLANLLANPDAGQIQNLAGLLSSSQQNQLQDLLKQVKGNDQPVQNQHEVQEPTPAVPSNTNQPTFEPHHDHQLPFLHSQVPDVESRQQPSFNREVLDFDYSDDEQTFPTKIANQTHGIDPSLLAKLPTRDQIQQLTSQQMSGVTEKVEAEAERMKRLEQEQEIFNKQIQQMSGNQSDRSVSAQRSDRGESRKRRRSRSRSRDRHHRHHRRRSHSRDRHRSRRSRSRDRSRRSRRSRSKSREKYRDDRREKTGFPSPKDGCISVCTTTLWIGNISAKVMQHELQAMVEEHGEVESINMIPPRGCAYVCMKKRVDADKALQKIRHFRLSGKSLKCDWAPSKEMPEDQKVTWVKEHGVNYVPVPLDPDQLRSLSTWGCIDPDSVPEGRKDDLNTPEVESATPSEADQSSQQSQPQMVPTFNPPTANIVPNPAAGNIVSNVPAAMVARPQMPAMMVRPFQVNPFGMPQRMRFQQPGFPNEQRPPMNEPSLESKPDLGGNTTPTADEHPDEPPPPQPVQAFQPPSFGPVSVAQRFPNAMPVQIRMMSGPMGQQMMPPRMGVMPIRMRLPMQLRPGFHPGMQRIPMHGGPQMMPGQMQQQLQHPRMRPPQPIRGFPGAIRIAAPPHRAPASEAQHFENMIRPSSPQMQGPERAPNPSIIGRPNQAPKNERGFDHPPPRDDPRQFGNPQDGEMKGVFGGPPPPGRDMVRPPREFGRQMSFERPNRDFGPPQNEVGPPRNMDLPPQSMDCPPRDIDCPPKNVDRPPKIMDRPPQIMDRPPQNMDRPPQNVDRPPQNVDRPSRDVDRPPRDMDHPPRDVDRPPRDVDRPPRDLDRPPRDMDRPPRDMDRPPRDMDRPSRDMDRPPRGMDRPPRDMDRPPRDGDRPSRDGDRPPRSGSRFQRDGDRSSRDDRPSRDSDRSSRDRRDHDRGRRERSRDRDRRDRDLDRDRRGRDSDRSFRDFDRGGRDTDRRDRGPPFRRGSFRGRDEGRGRGGFRGRGRGGGWSGGDRKRSPEVDPEEEEYKRKRQETLRKRHEEEDDYVVEQIDFSAFGLPSGFGGPVTGDEAKDDKTAEDGKTRSENSNSSAASRKEWLNEQNRSKPSSSDSTEPKNDGRNENVSPVPLDMEAQVDEISSAGQQNDGLILSPKSGGVSSTNNLSPPVHRSPGTPTYDEPGAYAEKGVIVQEIIEENEINEKPEIGDGQLDPTSPEKMDQS